MASVCLYLQVHQPYRLRPDYTFFQIGRSERYEDEEANRQHLVRIAQNCYLPTAGVLYDLVKKHQGAFRLALSFSGLVLDQLAAWAPDALETFQRLVATGAVEVLGETWNHSLSALFSEKEFAAEVSLHKRRIKEIFGVVPTTIRNTELIYSNAVAHLAEKAGFRAVLSEGTERALGWRSPHFVYAPADGDSMRLLMRDTKLSDDLAFRFSDPLWSERPFTPAKYAEWIRMAAEPGDTVNLFMDFETFGEHHRRDSGIFDFLWHFPDAVLAGQKMEFLTPSETVEKYRGESRVDIREAVSWADREKDLSAWMGNPLQDSALQYAYSLERPVLRCHDDALLAQWRRLLASDHFYYMCHKGDADGAVHRHFRPYASPYDAYVVYINILNDLRERVRRRGVRV